MAEEYKNQVRKKEIVPSGKPKVFIAAHKKCAVSLAYWKVIVALVALHQARGPALHDSFCNLSSSSGSHA